MTPPNGKITPSALRLSLLTALLLLVLLLSGETAAAPSPPRIRRITIEGAETFDTSRLEKLMGSSPGLFKTTRFTRERFDQDIDALLIFYRNEGFYDARVVEKQATPEADSGAVSLLIRIEEGPRTRVGAIRLEGMGHFSDAQLRPRLTPRVGAPFRRLQLQKDRRILQTFYAEAGYIDAEVGYQALQDTGYTATLVYTIQEGVPVRVGEIVIAGLDKTRPGVVVRELTLRSGQLYRLSKIRQSQRQLFETGLFRSALVEPGPPDSSRLQERDLAVTVRERRAGALELGTGYGTSERWRAGFALSQDNWRGKGLQLGFQGRLSRLARKSEGAFTSRWLFGLRLATDVRLFYRWERNDQADFTTQRTGGDIAFSHLFARIWRAEVKYLLERVRLLESASQTAPIPPRRTSSLSLALTRDSRDDLINPRQGSLWQGRIEYAGGFLRGGNQYVRPTSTLSFYRPLGDGWVWATRTQFLYIRTLGAESETVEYQRFYLGGENSLRGYPLKSIGAATIGNIACSGQTELRFPLGKLRGMIFVDAGNVWARLRDVDMDDLRFGYGGGLRYPSSFGLLRVDLGVHQGDRSLRRRMQIYVGVGHGI